MIVKTHNIVKKIFSKYLWNFNTSKKEIFLTFDDGPTPKITEWTLDLLAQYNAKATFFCIGKNVELYPEIFQKILKKGHSIGNHTQHHINGWYSSPEKYLDDINKCEESFKNQNLESKLFRPPYGKIRKKQAMPLLDKGYKIVMWDVLSRDYDLKLNAEDCYQNVINNITHGSIVVFHDSEKAFKRLKESLPRILEHLRKKDYQFSIIN